MFCFMLFVFCSLLLCTVGTTKVVFISSKNEWDGALLTKVSKRILILAILPTTSMLVKNRIHTVHMHMLCCIVFYKKIPLTPPNFLLFFPSLLQLLPHTNFYFDMLYFS
ncbi:hypothetical protein BDC45DRAFT_504865 [Circinella umbellata]|nr:hypothetical protein BDC45DRAFT_504865 [Circinella umbellata]